MAGWPTWGSVSEAIPSLTLLMEKTLEWLREDIQLLKITAGHPGSTPPGLSSLTSGSANTPTGLSRELPPEAPRLSICKAQNNPSPALHFPLELQGSSASQDLQSLHSQIFRTHSSEDRNCKQFPESNGSFPVAFLNSTSSSSHFKIKPKWQGISRNVTRSSAAVSNWEEGGCGKLWKI